MQNNFTQHAKIRMKQRGINRDAISMLEEFGKPSYGVGGVQVVSLTRKKRDRLIREYKRKILLIEKASKLKIIKNNDIIITVYHRK